ncbi:unnamed protein product [Pleuronectes platessa]|uniref:Uncharacterized protein n=1 Tax=Pleuronectes platessa TaxID=8262 RepID=A0A9N7U9G7_PLEPL|nr:unnamed protein product [Pleuronectes platessa]
MKSRRRGAEAAGASPSAPLHPSAFPPFNPNNATVLSATLCRLFQRTSKKEKQIEAAGDNETAGYVKAVHFGHLVHRPAHPQGSACGAPPLSASHPDDPTVDALNHECPGSSVEASQWSGQVGQQNQRQGPLRAEEEILQLQFYYA